MDQYIAFESNQLQQEAIAYLLDHAEEAKPQIVAWYGNLVGLAQDKRGLRDAGMADVLIKTLYPYDSTLS